MPAMSAAVGAGNTGISAVNVGAGGGTSDPTLQAQVSFTSAAGDYTWQLVDAAGQVTASGAGTLPAGQPLQINGLSLTLTGSPQPGDTLTARRATYTPDNNGNALLMVGLREQGIIDGKTPSEAYGAAMGDVGVRVQGAETSAKISGAVAADAQERVTSVTGVNLDEEAARLMQFQQSYQAAAKVLQVAQSVFETLLQTAAN
jgi:flagellar hook-associated protein 1 FlgK